MKIICGSCAAKYTVSDEKVQGKTVKVKCRKCGAVIVVSSTGEVQTAGAAAASAGHTDPGQSFTVSVSDSDQRTMTMAQIVDAYNDGVIDAETYVWAEGMDDWLALKDVDAIVDALHEAAAVADAAEAQAVGQPPDADLGATVAMSDPAYSGPAGYAAPAAAASPVGHAAAGGAAAAAPAQAAGGGAAPGGYFQNVSAPTASSGPSGPVAPTENSAIFSLNMLTAKVGNEEPESSSGSEDSGLIDLRALAAGMGGDAAEAAPVAMGSITDGPGVFPLGAPAAPPAVAQGAVSLPPQAAGGGNRGVLIALASAVVILGAALVFFLVRDTATPATSGPVATGAPTAAPTSTPTASETAAPAASTAAVASASASASASATAKVASRRYTGRRHTGGKGHSQSSSGGTKAHGTRSSGGGAKGACGCAASDLMCNMRCSQKRKKK